MNADDFLVLAIKLSASSGEAERRSAVSRAYYGAFHWGHGVVDSCGVTLSKEAVAHKEIARCLQHCGNCDVEAAGRELDSLRSERNAADYHLDDPRFTNPKFIEIQLGISRKIAETIARAPISQIQPQIRKYARDIMKLTVRGTI
jgi:uncharacterized protein (UPF0332 family)